MLNKNRKDFYEVEDYFKSLNKIKSMMPSPFF